jgi:predicted nucleic acid-binding Zn ribbon protein
MRRLAPRPLRRALDDALADAAPPGLLPRVQAVWPEVAGAVVAEESGPVSEREGTVTVACRSSVWAHELELLAGDLTARLNARLGAGSGGPAVTGLRFVVRRP